MRVDVNEAHLSTHFTPIAAMIAAFMAKKDKPFRLDDFSEAFEGAI